jgi:hypothetical protein
VNDEEEEEEVWACGLLPVWTCVMFECFVCALYLGVVA